MLFLAGVNYEHDRDTAGAADCMPALLFVNYAIEGTKRYLDLRRSAPPSQMRRPCFRRLTPKPFVYTKL
ncbi:hypothetical protein SBA4_6070015 [Candidatus Sulfopaludibacter sp. SbA4]|nr:hypothetical protein SBA4_6070015 [Candidatus Sulfopaludibacter sp. SbA4]